MFRSTRVLWHRGLSHHIRKLLIKASFDSYDNIRYINIL